MSANVANAVPFFWTIKSPVAPDAANATNTLLFELGVILIAPVPLPIVVVLLACVVWMVKSPDEFTVNVAGEIPAPEDARLNIPSLDPWRPTDNVSVVAASVRARMVPTGLEILNELNDGRLILKLVLVETIPPSLRLNIPFTFRFCWVRVVPKGL